VPAPRPPSQEQRAIAFGAEVRRLREAAGLKQHQLATQVFVDSSTMSRIERGQYGPPSDEAIERIAEALAADFLDLMRIAGRELDPASFQQRVLADIEQLRGELRAGFERLEALVARSEDR
jgi:HTH-type transcriptional regulator, competence development regulator